MTKQSFAKEDHVDLKRREEEKKNKQKHTHTQRSLYQCLSQSKLASPTVLWLIYSAVSFRDLGESDMSAHRK